MSSILRIVFTNITVSLFLYTVSTEPTEDAFTKSNYDVKTKNTYQKPVKSLPSEALESNPNLNILWVYNPLSYQSRMDDEAVPPRVVYSPPKPVTRLTKFGTYGVDPYFDRDFFEPFEGRSKPVTLVSFRKNSYLPRYNTKIDPKQPADAAELQSPYNYISTFWQDEPGL